MVLSINKIKRLNMIMAQYTLDGIYLALNYGKMIHRGNAMVSKTGMTLQDYFQLAGIKCDLNKLGSKARASAQSEIEGFRQIMTDNGKKFQTSLGKNAKSAPTSTSSIGLTLSDYFKYRIPAMKYLQPKGSSAIQLTESSPQKTRSMPLEAAPLRLSESPTALSIPLQTNLVAEQIYNSIKTAADKYNLDSALIHSVIQAESNFNVHAVSPAGAKGLMQLMPGTAKELGVKDIFNIEENIDGGTRYLKQMLDKFNGDIKLALAAYNAGPGTVQKYGKIPPFRETQAYVKRILNSMESKS